MTTSSFRIVDDYRPQGGDLVLLPFAGKKALFEPAGLPAELRGAAAPAEPGGVEAVFAGRIGRAGVRADAVRVDSEHRCEADGVKAAVARALEGGGSGRPGRVVVMLDAGRGAEFSVAAHEGAALGGYRFDRYLTRRKRPVPVVAALGGAAGPERRRAAADAKLFEEVNAARDLINEPGNVANPATVAAAFRKAGRRAGVRVEVWDRPRLRRERCGAVLAVGGASATPPRLVIGRYAPRRSCGEHLVLVGKGVTFDTGGYCLKPPAGMGAMKCDMGGAAAVFHAACAIARLKLPIRVSVVAPLVENAISGSGCRPGDIVRTRSGRTVQIDNTDAEGRLILADALDVAGGLGPTMVVDAATLTGACVIALGTEIAAVYSTERSLARRIIAAGGAWGEPFWEMPLYAPYRAGLRTPAADTSNIAGDRWGGSIVAALFLQDWAPKGVPWAHLDIAGSVFSEKPVNPLGPGAQGFAVRTLVELARDVCG